MPSKKALKEERVASLPDRGRRVSPPSKRKNIRISELKRSTTKPHIDFSKIMDAISKKSIHEYRVHVRRPKDHLIFDLIFENLQLASNKPLRLVKQDPNATAYFVAEFPPQCFGEEAFTDKPSLEKVPSLPSAKVRMAGRSRAAWLMPTSEKSLSYTLVGVLRAMRTWPMQLDINAVPELNPVIAPDSKGIIGFNREWLKSITGSPSWISTQANFTAWMKTQGVESAIMASANRIARLVTKVAAKGTQRRLSQDIQRTAQREMKQILHQFPILQKEGGNDVGRVALSLAVTKAISDTGSLGVIPFLPLILSPHKPSRNFTAIELPYRLLVSPLEPAHWSHEDNLVEHGGRIELWHTRLTTSKTDFGPDTPSKVRAIWSPDYPLDYEEEFRTSMTACERRMLVMNMAGFNEACLARRLHLSALGALLDVDGNWDERPDGSDVQQWRHLSALGRDHYVRVVKAGFLCPFGHAASLIKITERKFESLSVDSKQRRVAILRQRRFIVVRERVKKFDLESRSNHILEGRNFPFRSIEILTDVTPDLFLPESEADMLFWPSIFPPDDDVPFKFEIAATDLNGRRISFSMPLLFVGESANESMADRVQAAYNDLKTQEHRQTYTGSASICYAERILEDGDPKGDPQLPTQRLQFKAGKVKKHDRKYQANFYPEVEKAHVGIPAIQKLLQRPDAFVDVKYAEIFCKNGFTSKNPAEIFLQTETTKEFKLEFGEKSDQSKSDILGALATPGMNIQGLSRKIGPTADVENIVKNTFDPTKFFEGAKILGGISLSSILHVVENITDPANIDKVPKILSRELNDKTETLFCWETEIKVGSLNLIIPNSKTPTTKLVMRSKMSASLDSKDPNGDASYEAIANLNNFKVNLFGIVIISFENLKFVSRKGQKPDVTVDLTKGSEAVQFGGPLEFVNKLRELIPSNGFSDPPNLAVTPNGISAGYSLNLPKVEVGIFNLSGVSLGAGFNLPFDSRPASVRFAFSERQHPFSLTVSLLGGGGFFAIDISTRGVQEIEAALEFGAAVAIDLGVASGGVEIKGGIYFHWLEPLPDKGSLELAGYIRLHGELSVLGLISASLTFNLQLAYHKEAGKSIVWGEATLVIEIEVLFFSTDVSVHCRREFGGSASDPKFIDLVPDQETWNEYCNAFAEEGVP
jgi:hypothetical protein